MARTTINGTCLKPNGDPEEGHIYFSLYDSSNRPDIDARITRTPIRVNLDGSGQFSIQLEPTDDPDWSTSGLAYLVEERFSGKAAHRFYIPVPTSGSAIRYEDLAAVGNAPAIDGSVDLAAEWVAWQAAANATYAHQDRMFVNVMDHGAVGDGVTDDTAAINAAIAASTWPATQATIYFPPKVYKVTGSITINGGGATSTPMIDLLGWGAKITTATAGINVFNITNSIVSLTRVRLRGFQLHSNAGSAMTHVRLNNAQMCTLDSLDILGSYSTGVKIEGTSTYNTIQSCAFHNMAQGINIPGGAHYLTINGCHFGEQTSGSPLNWVDANTVQTVGVKVVGCTFYGEGNTSPAVNIVQGYGWTIQGCHFAQCSDVALFIGVDGTSYGHTISGCTFQSNGKDDIKINGGRLNTISGNYFGTRKSGTTASTYCNVTILNTFGGAAGSDNSVIGNTSRDNSGVALLAPFRADSACQNVTMIGNQFTVAKVGAHVSNAFFDRDGGQLPTGKQIVRDGISLPSVLARVTGIDAKTVAATNLYTVPTGKTAIITGAVVQSGSVTAITVGPTLGIGIAAGEDDIVPSTALAALTSNVKTGYLAPTGVVASAPAASVIKVGIDTASTGTAQTVHVALIGYLL